MEIILAKSAGFCFGVNRAIEAVYGAIGGEKIYTYGQVIHNKEVTRDLESKGVDVIESIENIENCTIVIRSHGVGKSIYDKLSEKKLRVIDGTCPFVKKIHSIVKENYNDGQNIIIIGDKTHPEVIGINGWCNNSAIIINDYEEIKEIFF